MKSNKKVGFNLELNEYYDVPYEDRKSEWIELAINRMHFRNRINRVAEMLKNVLNKRQ